MNKTKIIHVNPLCFSQQELAEGGRLLREGKLVVFPTETVYGLGANALDGEACKAIYTAKGRPADNPLIVHLPDLSGLEQLCRLIPQKAYELFEAYSPGPLTVILPKRECVPEAVTCGLDTVAIRIPSHPVAAALLREARVPVAAPSANRSGRPSPTRLSHVVEDLDGLVDLMIDGGECGVGLESTVVSLAGERPVLLRPGGISLKMLEQVLGEVEVDRAVTGQLAEGQRPQAPGMKYRHYAPKAQLTLGHGDPAALRQWLIACSEQENVGILCYEEDVAAFPHAAHVVSLGRRDDLEAQAHALFDALRSFDETGVSAIFGPLPEMEGIGLAVRNRLLKAAGHRVVEL
ncbi:MAG: threonylcarbamoyl-AMP synthase [Clostridia bacterium]|nr:threonylcarbamoyl-AMP synthase [Clostridia bacterium]